MAKKTKTQRIRTKTAPIGGKLYGGKRGRFSYLVLRDLDGNYVDTLSGQSLYRLAKAVVRRFEAAGR